MRLSDILFLAYTTLIRYPLRTIMLLIATSIGVMAVILLTAVAKVLETTLLVSSEALERIF